MGALEPPHLILILVIVLIIFGPGKLPQLGKAAGDGLRELKRATSEEAGGKPASSEGPATAPVAPTAPLTWNCAHCGKRVPVTDRFCGTCGAARELPHKAAVI